MKESLTRIMLVTFIVSFITIVGLLAGLVYLVKQAIAGHWGGVYLVSIALAAFSTFHAYAKRSKTNTNLDR